MMDGFGRGWGSGYGDMMGGGWLGSGLVFFFGLLFVIGVVLLVVWAVRSSSGHGASGGSTSVPGMPGHDEAVAIAKRRLASGEITADEYDEILRTLGGGV